MKYNINQGKSPRQIVSQQDHMSSLQWKWRARGVLALLSAFLCLVLLAPHLLWPSIKDLTEVEKCPACYGVSLCPAITGGLLTLRSFGAVAGLMNTFGSKNVLFGMLGNQKVVLKKLGHAAELDQLDKMICEAASLGSSCRVNEAIWQQGDLLYSVRQHVSRPMASQDNVFLETSGLHLCPTVTNLELFLSSVLHENRGIGTRVLHANIWTIVMINPEPLILQVLREEEGWPVAKYVGACGRVVVEEYAGEMLTSYHQAPWLLRARLAYQLLIAAHNFTDSHPFFGFYLTDISADNIAVDARGKLRFIDLENVIVIDRNVPHEDRPLSWNAPHKSETFDCDGCFAFSAEDICSHRRSDHNFYAVCQHLLGPLAAPDVIPGGLLHDTPPVHARVLELVQECSEPTEPSGRLRAAQDLTALLAKVLHEHV